MKKITVSAKIISALIAVCFVCAGKVYSAPAKLVAISADIVEISGSLDVTKGFIWNEALTFGETSIPGIIKVGEFARATSLSTDLKALEEKGLSRTIAKPSQTVQDGQQSQILIGGELPYPVANNTGVSVEFKKYGVLLNTVPFITSQAEKTINLQFQLEVSNPSSEKSVIVNGYPVNAMVTRKMQSVVEVKSGETVVIGGLKNSYTNTAVKRIPVLGYIPFFGALFTQKTVSESQRSLFMFISAEIVS